MNPNGTKIVGRNPHGECLRWQPYEYDRLKELRLNNHTITEIARIMGRPKASVCQKLRNLGQPPINPRGPLWTDDEKQQLISLRRDGYSLVDIAKKIGRKYSAVKKKYGDIRNAGVRMEPVVKPKQRKAALPVAQSDWLRPLTKAQLMAGRA